MENKSNLSLRKKPSLQRWEIILHALLLSAIAGYINMVTIIRFGFTTTHHTGNITKLAMSLERYQIDVWLPLVALVLSFFFGAAIAGFFFFDRRIILTKEYGVVFIGIGSILLLLDRLMPVFWMPFAISMIAGLQNGLHMKLKGVMIRTTHISGTLTDAGFEVGAWLRGEKEVGWKIGFYVLMILTFMAGGLISAYCQLKLDQWVITLIAVVYILYGGWLVHYTRAYRNLDEYIA